MGPGPAPSPEELQQSHHLRLAAAWVRGTLAGRHPDPLLAAPWEQLGPAQWAALVDLGRSQGGLRLHRFKRARALPRVARVLGLLRGLGPADLLDVGSGRGVFLWSLLEAFPALPVTTIDLLAHRSQLAAAVARGGEARLRPLRMDATALALADGAVDVACALEVLEHVPAVERAAAELVRVARRFVVCSVPSKPDDNPGHIHLLDRPRLGRIFEAAGAREVTFLGVPNHHIALAKLA